MVVILSSNKPNLEIMAEGDGEGSYSLERLEKELINLEDPYKCCQEIYEEVLSNIWDDSDTDKYVLDPLTLSMLQHHVTNADTTIKTILHERIELLKSRELRVLVAGEVAAGKTTVINLMMGDKYLPVDNHHCTNIVCELRHTEEVRKAELIYKDGSGQVILGISTDRDDDIWKSIRLYIRDACDENQQQIDKIIIYWPFEIFKDTDQTFPMVVADESHNSKSTNGEETNPKQIYNDSVTENMIATGIMSSKHQYSIESTLQKENHIFISKERHLNDKWHPGTGDWGRDYNSDTTEEKWSSNLGKVSTLHRRDEADDSGSYSDTENLIPKTDSEDGEDDPGAYSDYEDVVPESNEQGDEIVKERQQCYTNVPVVFIDCPGIEEKPITFEPTMRCLLKCHTFIFIINVANVGGVSESRLQKLMDEISKTIDRQGVPFNAESAIFVINKWNLCQVKVEELRKDVLKRLRDEWGVISEEQLFVLPIEKMELGENGLQVIFKMKPFQECLFKFLIASVRRNLEDHCLWLKNFLEVMHALMKTGKRWENFGDRLSKIQSMAKKERQRLLDYFEQVPTSQFKQKLEKEQKRAKHSVSKLTKHNKALKAYLASPNKNRYDGLKKELKEVEEIYSKFQKNVDALVEAEREIVLNTSWFTDLNLHQANDDETHMYLKAGVLIGTILSPVTMPIVKIAFLCIAIYDGLLKDWTKIFDDYVKKSLHSLNMGMSKYLKNIEMLINGKTSQTTDATLRRLKGQIRKIGELYIGKVIQHEFDAKEIRGKLIDENLRYRSIYEITIAGFKDKVAVKKLSSSSHECKHSDSLSLPLNWIIYRECIQLRQLSRKTCHQFYDNFVGYMGSAIYEHDNRYHLLLIMELCDYDMSTVIVNGNLSHKLKVKYALEAARGLQFFHDNGIVHRDIKPDNFLIKNDVVKIADVDHSKELDQIATLGSSRGTNHYRAPETSAPDQYHTYESDVYSLGLVFWELWYHQRVPRERPVRFQEPLPYPTLLLRIITHCLNENPKTRPKIQTVVYLLNKVFKDL